MSAVIIFDAKPKPAPRPRVTRYGTYNDPKYTAYKKALSLTASSKIKTPFSGAISMKLIFQFAKPKSWSKKKRDKAFWHTQKPDSDNLAKAVKDALNGVAYADDSQVCEMQIIKIWGDTDKVVIELDEIEIMQKRI